MACAGWEGKSSGFWMIFIALHNIEVVGATICHSQTIWDEARMHVELVSSRLFHKTSWDIDNNLFFHSLSSAQHTICCFSRARDLSSFFVYLFSSSFFNSPHSPFFLDFFGLLYFSKAGNSMTRLKYFLFLTVWAARSSMRLEFPLFIRS